MNLFNTTRASRRGLLALTGGAAALALGPVSFGSPVRADLTQGFSFASIDGGTLDLADWAGRPILVVNTASRCAFTPQYDALQALYDRYRADGLVVMAVPSNDFRQELASEAEVKAFCELNFGLDLPMTEITRVTGRSAHPFYRWLAMEHGVRPMWNFNKVLLGPGGELVASYGSRTSPLAPNLTGEIEALLAR